MFPTDNLVIRELDDETLVYDTERSESPLASTKPRPWFGSSAMKDDRDAGRAITSKLFESSRR